MGPFLKVFISGPPGVGKSTVLDKARAMFQARGYKVGGVSCPEVRKSGVRIGFRVVDVASDISDVLSEVKPGCGGPKVGKYTVNLLDLDSVGARALDYAVREADVVMIDEVGPMELMSKAFQAAVLRAVNSPRHVMGILHWRMEHPLISAIRSRDDVEFEEVTPQNRDYLPMQIVEKLVAEAPKKA
jgi:nucleoside-triphosphatase